jgi:hypothetical protein
MTPHNDSFAKVHIGSKRLCFITAACKRISLFFNLLNLLIMGQCHQRCVPVDTQAHRLGRHYKSDGNQSEILHNLRNGAMAFENLLSREQI